MPVNKYIAAGIFTLAIVLGAFFILSNSNKSGGNDTKNIQTTKQSENLDHKASFAIYTNGTFRIFTASMYHNLSSGVFIEASNPNIINVKKSNITWADFFATLPFKLDENCLTTGTKQTFCSDEQFILQFYLNGKRNQSVLNQIINPQDKLLVTYEQENSSLIQEQLQSIPNPE